jgi:hypothetical protein
MCKSYLTEVATPKAEGAWYVVAADVVRIDWEASADGPSLWYAGCSVLF